MQPANDDIVGSANSLQPTGPGSTGFDQRDYAWNASLTILPVEPPPRLHWAERCGLVLVATGMGLVLAVARWLHPYDGNGRPLRLGTHEQLGLPPCAFYRATGIPCPTCGLTTSFSLCLHGDWRAAWRANNVGPILVVAFILGGFWFLLAGLTGYRLRLPTWHALSTLAAWSLLCLVLGSWLVRLINIIHGVHG